MDVTETQTRSVVPNRMRVPSQACRGNREDLAEPNSIIDSF